MYRALSSSVAFATLGFTVAFAASVRADASPALAASPAPSPSSSPSAALRYIGNVVTSDRRSEPISQSSKPTFVVDRARIDAFGARTVQDALQGVPGVELYSYGAFGSLVSYGVRGSSTAQTLVLVDGQPVADPTTGAAYLAQLSTIGVQRIEIVESGSSTLYGTSASGGVINVITSVPRGEYFTISGGSFSDRDVRGSIGNGTLGFSYERHVSTNDYDYPALAYGPKSCTFGAPGPCSFAAGVREGAYADQSVYRAQLDLPLGGGFRIRARADDTNLDTGIPGDLQFGATPNDTQGLANATGLVELEHAARRSTQSLTVSGADQRLAYDDTFNGEDDTYSGRVRVSLKDVTTIGAEDLVAGIDLDRESGNFSFPSSPIYNADFTQIVGTAPPSALGRTQSQAAAYLQLGASPFAGSRFTAGLRAEHDSPAGSVLAPAFGGVINAGALRISGNLGESFRVPTLQDLYYPGASNPNLLPEKAATADATVAYESKRGSLSIGWFGRSGSNFIISAPPLYVPSNAEHAQVAGIAVTAQSKPIAGFVADASFTDLYRALDTDTGGRLPNDPTGQASVGISKPFGADRLAYGVRWTIVGSDGADKAVVAPPLRGTYDAFDSADAFLRYKLADHAILSIRGFNLGNSHDVPIFGYPAPGRRLYAEFSTQ